MIIGHITAKITGRGAESTVPSNPNAVDADLFGEDNVYIGGVTLLPNEFTGELDIWGWDESWACQDLLRAISSEDGGLRDDLVAEVVGAVQEAAKTA